MLGARHDGPRHLYHLILNRKGKPPSNLHCDDGIRSDTELAQYRFPHKWQGSDQLIGLDKWVSDPTGRLVNQFRFCFAIEIGPLGGVGGGD